MAEVLLAVDGLSKRFGGIVAADAIALDVAAGGGDIAALPRRAYLGEQPLR